MHLVARVDWDAASPLDELHGLGHLHGLYQLDGLVYSVHSLTAHFLTPACGGVDGKGPGLGCRGSAVPGQLDLEGVETLQLK